MDLSHGSKFADEDCLKKMSYVCDIRKRATFLNLLCISAFSSGVATEYSLCNSVKRFMFSRPYLRHVFLHHIQIHPFWSSPFFSFSSQLYTSSKRHCFLASLQNLPLRHPRHNFLISSVLNLYTYRHFLEPPLSSSPSRFNQSPDLHNTLSTSSVYPHFAL